MLRCQQQQKSGRIRSDLSQASRRTSARLHLRTTRCLALLILSLAQQLSAQQTSAANTVIAELRSGQAIEALRDADLALIVNPKDARMLALKGLAARQLDQPGVALVAFQSSLAIDPTYLPALEGACELLYAKSAPETQAYLDRLLAQLPDEPSANGMAAMLAYRAANYTAAAEHFSKAVSVISNQQSAMDAYADSLARLQQDAEALKLLQTVVDRWPSDSTARYNLAVLESRTNETRSALLVLEPLLAQNDAAALSLAAALHEAAGETPAAVDLLRRAIAADPKNPQNYIDFAALSFDHSSAHAGIVMLNAGLTQLPESARLYVARGILSMQISDTAAAERDFARANQLDPTQTFGFEAQGLSEIQRHNLPEALRKIKSTLAQRSDDAYLNYLAAEILKEQGITPHSKESAEALAYAQRAVRLDPSLVAAHNVLGALAFAEGDLLTALAQSRSALERDPADEESLFRLVLLLRRTGDPKQEVPALVQRLQTLRATAHSKGQKLERYQLVEAGAPQH